MMLLKFFAKTAYRREIVAVVLLKLLGLTLLWLFFFSHPLSRQLDARVLAKHYVTDTFSKQ